MENRKRVKRSQNEITEIYEAIAFGDSFAEVASIHGVSSGRIRQIVTKERRRRKRLAHDILFKEKNHSRLESAGHQGHRFTIFAVDQHNSDQASLNDIVCKTKSASESQRFLELSRTENGYVYACYDNEKNSFVWETSESGRFQDLKDLMK